MPTSAVIKYKSGETKKIASLEGTKEVTEVIWTKDIEEITIYSKIGAFLMFIRPEKVELENDYKAYPEDPMSKSSTERE